MERIESNGGSKSIFTLLVSLNVVPEFEIRSRNRWITFTTLILQVMESEAFDYLDAPCTRVAGADIPMPYAKQLEDEANIKPSDVVTSVLKMKGIM